MKVPGMIVGKFGIQSPIGYHETDSRDHSNKVLYGELGSARWSKLSHCDIQKG